MIVANLLADRGIPFTYETALYAPDVTFYLPDFTLTCRGMRWYWEHLGLMHDTEYRAHWQQKADWYRKHGFAQQVIVTTESKGVDSAAFAEIIDNLLGGALAFLVDLANRDGIKRAVESHRLFDWHAPSSPPSSTAASPSSAPSS
ncbi:MAG: hypothetical protein AB1503_12180, partial [Bacillota bacterium]